MKFKKGHYRFVFVFPSLGIAIKFPIIRLWCLVKNIVYLTVRMRWESLWREMSSSIDFDFGLKGLLFRGIVDNWREFLFFRKTRNIFLQPTYFSFFGLLNIQKTSEPCMLNYVDLWCQLYELTGGKVFDDSHHFENPDNFCFANGKLMILDYGSKGTHGVINEFGAKIFESFDPAFSWEEKKKALAAQKTE